MKISSKTPYEIRLELLQLSQKILDAKHKADCAPVAPSTAPTTEEIILEAEKLNGFVSNTPSSISH